MTDSKSSTTHGNTNKNINENGSNNIHTSDTPDYLSVADYDYELPDDLIARYPLAQRSASKLLHLSSTGYIKDHLFTDLPSLLSAGDLIVFNDTKVMKARLFGKKETGGRVEVLIERLIEHSDSSANDYLNTHHAITDTHTDNFDNNHDHLLSEYQNVALCHIKASKAPKLGQQLWLADRQMSAKMVGRQDNLFLLAFDAPILPDLERYGELPIPPYFERHADATDNTRYQTVFHDPAKLASVAAPTASLHFDDAILTALANKGINKTFVTLHVGAGTFAPVKTDNLLNHTMHSEYAALSQETADLINQTHAQGNKVIAVGTTVARVLETAYQKTANNGRLSLGAWSGDTDIFIYPGFEFGVIDRLLTNFHLPKSTLLMLVSAFAGKTVIEQGYQHAIDNQYRFFSYGDAMLLDR